MNERAFAWLAFALPLVAAGHAPLWLLPLLGWGYWVARRSDHARQAALSVVVVIALAGSLTGLPHGLSVTALFLRLLLVSATLNVALDRLEERRTWGLALAALVWLAAPTPLGLMGLAACAALFGAASQPGVRSLQAGRATALMAALTVALGIGAAFLPVPRWPIVGPAPAAVTRPQAHTSPGVLGRVPGAGRARSKETETATLQQPETGAALPRLLDVLAGLTLPLVLVTLLLFAYRVWRAHSAPHLGAPRHWTDATPVIAVYGSLLMLALYGLLRRTADEAGSSAPASRAGGGALSGVGRPPTEGSAHQLGTAVGWLIAVGLCLTVLLLLAGITLMLRAPYEQARSPKTDVPEEDASPATTSASGHRVSGHWVRAAYRRVLAALAGVGVVRFPSETPSELTVRAAQRYPALQGGLAVLTGMYLRVRYGGNASDENAATAEQLADQVQRALKESHE